MKCIIRRSVNSVEPIVERLPMILAACKGKYADTISRTYQCRPLSLKCSQRRLAILKIRVLETCALKRLCEKIYTDPSRNPTLAQLPNKGKSVAKANADQAKVLADEKTLAAEEKREWVQQRLENLAEMEEHSAQEMESEGIMATGGQMSEAGARIGFASRMITRFRCWLR